MNERIKELAEQATASISYRVCQNTFKEIDDPSGPFVRKEFSKEKFAELIIKECVDKVDKAGSNFNEQPQYNDKQNALVSEGFFWALESVKQQVKEHFGVKE